MILVTSAVNNDGTTSQFFVVLSNFWIQYLDFRMVRGNTKPYQSKWYRKMFIHVHDGIFDARHHLVSGVEARRSRSNDGHSKRTPIFDNMAVVALLVWAARADGWS